MRAMRVVLWAGWVTACHPEPLLDTAAMAADPCFSLPNPTLEIGLWDGEADVFVSLETPATIEIMSGPQGGRYVAVGLRATHLNAWTYIDGTLQASSEDTLLSEAQPWLDFECGPYGQDAFGAILPFDASAEELHDTEITVTAKVTDASGHNARTEVVWRLIDPEQATTSPL